MKEDQRSGEREIARGYFGGLGEKLNNLRRRITGIEEREWQRERQQKIDLIIKEREQRIRIYNEVLGAAKGQGITITPYPISFAGKDYFLSNAGILDEIDSYEEEGSPYTIAFSTEQELGSQARHSPQAQQELDISRESSSSSDNGWTQIGRADNPKYHEAQQKFHDASEPLISSYMEANEPVERRHFNEVHKSWAETDWQKIDDTCGDCDHGYNIINYDGTTKDVCSHCNGTGYLDIDQIKKAREPQWESYASSLRQHAESFAVNTIQEKMRNGELELPGWTANPGRGDLRCTLSPTQGVYAKVEKIEPEVGSLDGLFWK